MQALPADIIAILTMFAPLFSQPTFEHAKLLLVGAILAPVEALETKARLYKACRGGETGGNAGASQPGRLDSGPITVGILLLIPATRVYGARTAYIGRD